jgi:hypothetical protein
MVFNSLMEKLAIVAPIVPPKTITAAVICIKAPAFPPSKRKPPTRHTVAPTIPIIIALSKS